MKKLILLSIFTFYLLPFSFSQEYGWTDISANLPEYANCNDVHFIGDECWITGWNDGLIYTPDGGETFQIQTLPENSGISSSIFMKNNLNGYVVTFNGIILKTNDGGTNWTTLHGPGGGLSSVHFPPTMDKGYTCGNTGKIYAFTDNEIDDLTTEGLTATLQSIMFPENSSEGKLCGEATIRRWLNNTWDNLQIFDNTYIFNSIFFTDNNTGWVVGSQGKIFKTVDATIWNPQMSGTTKSLNDVFFIDSLEGWAAGTEVLLHTIDGGLNWTQELASQTVGKELRAICFTSAHNGYIVGNGVVLKYGELSGIGEVTKTLQCNIFPNPAKDKLQIKCSDFKTESGTIAILSIDGKEVLKKEIRQGSENIEIDVSHLETGMYLCKISTNKKSSTKKLIIE